MATQTKGKTQGDVIVHIDNPIFVFESAFVANPHDAKYTFPVGYPVSLANMVNGKDGEATPLAAAAIANLEAILAEEVTLEAEETSVLQHKVLIRGPATINKDALPTTDYDDAAFNMTNFETALIALDNVIVRVEPPEQTQAVK